MISDPMNDLYEINRQLLDRCKDSRKELELKQNDWIESCVEFDKLQARSQKLVEALEFHEDKDNWDDDKFNPTIWDDGNIDMGRRARAALKEFKGE